ncbi:MAG: DUF1015 domain-containing protein [Syntrophorhabdaceae bacterium]|nr:DUF1015 domain-containing protein [Syntrophorhabdaceae bacterium]
MADVKPFRGIHYDLGRIGNLSDVVAPPYDVISPEEREALYRRHSCNIVRIDFGKKEEGDTPGADVYSRAALFFRDWRSNGTLTQDPAPSLYYYEQEFVIAGKRAYVRKGFLGALKLSPFGEGEVFPHERTLSGPKQDRLSLMRATDAHMSPIFGLYSDPSNAVLKGLCAGMRPKPDLSATDDLGVKHRVWVVSDAGAIRAAVENMAGKGVFIADGHHRYETALAFRDEMRSKHGSDTAAAYEHVLTFLCNMDDEGIVILPTHRGIHSLSGFSEEMFLSAVRRFLPVESREGSSEDAILAVEEAGRRGKAIAWSAGGNRYHLITFPDIDRFCEANLSKFPLQLRSLDVALLHGFLIEQLLGISAEAVTGGKFVKYYKDPLKAAEDLSSGAIQLAFFLNAVTIPEFRDVSLSGHVLPQKSTFFYPKIGTGLLIFPVGPEDKVG